MVYCSVIYITQGRRRQKVVFVSLDRLFGRYLKMSFFHFMECSQDSFHVSCQWKVFSCHHVQHSSIFKILVKIFLMGPLNCRCSLFWLSGNGLSLKEMLGNWVFIFLCCCCSFLTCITSALLWFASEWFIWLRNFIYTILNIPSTLLSIS